MFAKRRKRSEKWIVDGSNNVAVNDQYLVNNQFEVNQVSICQDRYRHLEDNNKYSFIIQQKISILLDKLDDLEDAIDLLRWLK